MKNLYGILAFAFTALLPHSCQTTPPPIKPPVVAPMGPAAAAVPPAVTAADKPADSVLSKISAAAGVIGSLNAGQPPSPATQGVQGEAAGIQQLAGPPTAEDKAAADERERTVRAGNLAKINLLYQQEHDANVGLRVAADEARAARDKAISDAKAEAETNRKSFQTEIDRITREANERVNSAAVKAKAEADAKLNFWLQIGSFGLGILCLVLAAAATQFAVYAPFLGPNIIRLLAAAGGTLIVIGLLIRAVDRFVDQHPYIFWASLLTVVLAIVGALLLAWSNHHHLPKVATVPPAPAG
jgi:hypothetical protein